MPLLQLTIDAKIDGASVPGWPVTIVKDADEAAVFNFTHAGDSNDTSFTALPIGEVDSVEALLFLTNSAAGIRVEGGEGTNVAIRLAAGGGLVIWGSSLTDTNVTANINSATAGQMLGAAVGT